MKTLKALKSQTISSIAVVALLFAGFANATPPDRNVQKYEKTFKSKKVAKSKIVGSWRINISPDGGGFFTNLATFHNDYTTTGSDTAGGVGVGIWKRVGKHEFDMKQITLCECDGVPPGGYVEVVANMHYDKHSDTMSGTFTTSIYDAGDNVVVAFTGTATADRITF